MKMMDCLLMSPARTVVERASTRRRPRLVIMVRREDRCDDLMVSPVH